MRGDYCMTGVLARFAIVAAAWWLTMGMLFPRGGLSAVFAPPLVLIIGSVWAAGSIRSDRASRIGVGLTCSIGAYFAMLGVVGTQGMSGREGGGEVLVYFAAVFAASYGIAAVIFMLPILRVSPRAYAIGVGGFVAGGLLSTLPAAMALSAGVFNFFTAPLLVVAPMFVGVASLAEWGDSADSDGRYNRRTRP
jgi:hypothetical protein